MASSSSFFPPVDVAFEYDEDKQAMAMLCGWLPKVQVRPMAQAEPLLYTVLADTLPAHARVSVVGCRDGALAIMLDTALRHRDKRATFWCTDAIDAAFDKNAAAWGLDVVKAPPTATADDTQGIECALVDGTRISRDLHSVVAQQAAITRGWLLVRGSDSPAVTAALATAGFRAIMMEPPYGTHVSVCHRDEDALRAFGDDLGKILDKMDAMERGGGADGEGV